MLPETAAAPAATPADSMSRHAMAVREVDRAWWMEAAERGLGEADEPLLM